MTTTNSMERIGTITIAALLSLLVASCDQSFEPYAATMIGTPYRCAVDSAWVDSVNELNPERRWMTDCFNPCEQYVQFGYGHYYDYYPKRWDLYHEAADRGGEIVMWNYLTYPIWFSMLIIMPSENGDYIVQYNVYGESFDVKLASRLSESEADTLRLRVRRVFDKINALSADESIADHVRASMRHGQSMWDYRGFIGVSFLKGDPEFGFMLSPGGATSIAPEAMHKEVILTVNWHFVAFNEEWERWNEVPDSVWKESER